MQRLRLLILSQVETTLSPTVVKVGSKNALFLLVPLHKHHSYAKDKYVSAGHNR